MDNVKNRRRKERAGVASTVQVAWEDRGRRVVKARVLDLSEHGIRVEMPEQIDVRRIAYVTSLDLGISANTSVRHCNRAGNKFVIGMEFTGGMTGSPAGAPLRSHGSSRG